MSGPAQCYLGSNWMRYYGHDHDDKIPEGFAVLAINNNGWAGTNNVWPMVGQPALFPIAQAEAMTVAWNSALERIPEAIVTPQAISEEARRWLRWPEVSR